MDDGDLQRELSLELSPKGKKGRIDGKPPAQLRSYFDNIRAVLFAPEDTEIVRGGPDLRRAFLDRAAFTASASFLDIAWQFRRLLDQRSALLRAFPVDPIQLGIFDEHLARAGAQLVQRRRRILEELVAPFTELHERISGHGQATLRYRSSLPDSQDLDELSAAYLELLEKHRSSEIEQGRNLVGAQRDDLDIRLDGKSARSFASQGQTRSLVLALKLAELLAARTRGAQPLFLLDDLSSELDRFRRGRLVELLAELDLQVFVTTTDPSVVQVDDPSEVRSMRVEEGALSG